MRIPLREYRALLARYLAPQAGQVVLLAVLLLGSIALQLAGPQILRLFLDSAQAGGAMHDLIRLALLFLGLALVQQISSVAGAYVGERVGWAATNALRADLAAHCLRLDLSFHNAHTPGEMIERIDGDVTALTNFFSQFVVQVVGNVLLLAGILVVLFLVDWRVGLALALFTLLALLVLARFRDVAVPHWKAERQVSADLFGFLEERLAGTEDIRANGAEGYVMRRFHLLMRDLLRRSLKASLMWNILFNVTLFLFALGTAAAFGVSTYLFDRELLSLGTVYAVFYYSNMLQHPIDAITVEMQSLQRAGAALVRVRELLQTQSRLIVGMQGSLLPQGSLSVELRNVSFGYTDQASSSDSTGDLVLHDISFRLEPGSVLGLLGRTGSGKTTLTRLLLRLYDPDSGQVFLGDPSGPVDIRDLPLAHLRRRVGMVTQNTQLFHGTVRDNLTLFDPLVPDERVRAVIAGLGLEEWLRSLPLGLDTLLESGGGLSAGEAQLLAFARIFLRDPGLVILDEASSRLDPATERLVERAVERLVRGRTAIIIAHRLQTVHRADHILILQSGRAMEWGERAALAADPLSCFHRLLEAGLEEVLA
ncbi:MAG TPA: ABC transporter ATP-binding protein [Anaerolineae bacterium]|nr:ABC transporter ATP-binding protein [Anaerolineae bacterium]